MKPHEVNQYLQEEVKNGRSPIIVGWLYELNEVWREKIEQNDFV